MTIYSSVESPPGIGSRLRITGIFFLAALAIGCGDKNNDGIEAILIADFTGANFGNGGFYPDQFITPATLTIGIKSVQLILSGETSPSYTLFDTGDSTLPIVLDLDTIEQQAGINSVFPGGCPCSFAKVQMEITYFEMIVPLYTSASVFINRKMRFYTLDTLSPVLPADVVAGEVLIGDGSTLPNFSWVDLLNGSFFSLTGSRPSNALQVPASRFPNNSYSSIVTVDMLPFLEIPDNPEGIITVTITVQAGGLFFYDDTDSPANSQFDLYTDGLLNANEPDSLYYPTFPEITAVAEILP